MPEFSPRVLQHQIADATGDFSNELDLGFEFDFIYNANPITVGDFEAILDRYPSDPPMEKLAILNSIDFPVTDPPPPNPLEAFQYPPFVYFKTSGRHDDRVCTYNGRDRWGSIFSAARLILRFHVVATCMFGIERIHRIQAVLGACFFIYTDLYGSPELGILFIFFIYL
jgi:hypothetical protein